QRREPTSVSRQRETGRQLKVTGDPIASSQFNVGRLSGVNDRLDRLGGHRTGGPIAKVGHDQLTHVQLTRRDTFKYELAVSIGGRIKVIAQLPHSRIFG